MTTYRRCLPWAHTPVLQRVRSLAILVWENDGNRKFGPKNYKALLEQMRARYPELMEAADQIAMERIGRPIDANVLGNRVHKAYYDNRLDRGDRRVAVSGEHPMNAYPSVWAECVEAFHRMR